MPDAFSDAHMNPNPPSMRLSDLKISGKDSLGATIKAILFRGQDYVVYRSDRGVYVHFSDTPATEQEQRSVYVKLSVEICELRYLTSQSLTLNSFATSQTPNQQHR